MKCFYLADKEKPRPKKVAACSITIFNYGLSSCRIIEISVFVCFHMFCEGLKKIYFSMDYN